MTKYIDKTVIENILHKLWKKDTGYEYVDIARIAYNRALQDVQCEIDTIEVQEEPVSEELEEAAKESVDAEDYCYIDENGMPLYDSAYLEYMFKEGAKWQKEQIEEALLSEVLPCFMHGGEADEVMAKLDEVLNEKKKED